VKRLLPLVFVLCALIPVRATAAPLSATVNFSINAAGNLVVDLKNTATGDVWDPASVLTGVFFDIKDNPTLTPLTASICLGCSVTNGGLTDAGGLVNGEWAYKQQTDLAYGADYGISSAGLGLFGSKDLFPGGTTFSNSAPGGVAYGITTTDDDPTTNGGLKGVPLISNEVLFTFALVGLPGTLDLGSIGHVTFQYGTALYETPEPATLLLFVPGALTAWAIRRRRRARA
jgi:hypothetical protein